MSRAGRVGVALVAASIMEAIFAVVLVRYGHIGGDGPDRIGAIGLVFHFPGMMLADRFHLTGTFDAVVVFFIGFVQLFLISWFAIVAWTRYRNCSVNS